MKANATLIFLCCLLLIPVISSGQDEKISKDYPFPKKNYLNNSAENDRYQVITNYETPRALEVFDKKQENKHIASYSLTANNSVTYLKLTDNDELLIGTEKGKALLWNFTDVNAPPKFIPQGPRNGNRKGVNGMLQTPTKKHVYTFAGNTAKYCSINQSSSPIKVTSNQNKSLFTSTISNEGTAAAGGWDNFVNLYEKGEVAQTIRTNQFTSILAFSRDGKYLAIGGSYGKMTLLINPTHLIGNNFKTLVASVIQLNINEKENQAPPTPNTKKRLREVTKSIKSSLPTIRQEEEAQQQTSSDPASKIRRLLF